MLHYKYRQPRFLRYSMYSPQHLQCCRCCRCSRRCSCRQSRSSRICWSIQSRKWHRHYMDQSQQPQLSSRKPNPYSNCMSRIPAGQRQDTRMCLLRCSSHQRRFHSPRGTRSGNRFRWRCLCSFLRHCRTGRRLRSLFLCRMPNCHKHSCCRSHPRIRRMNRDMSGSYR